MRHHTRPVLILIALLLAGLAAWGAAPHTASQAKTVADPVLRPLRFVPDTSNTRGWLAYGDLAAWHTSWDVPRIDNVAELDGLENDPRIYWMFIMPRQTQPPDSLGVQYLMQGDYRPAFGFDLFNLDRFLQAGYPPDAITAAEGSFEAAQIEDALAASGYTAQPLETGGTLYSIREDYEMDPASDLPMPGRLGALNRIALLEGGKLLIARATGVVTQ
jgi:hypothetical protein